jgi:hypothetical protein
VSELLDRVRSEIRERLEAARSAVLEYERLEAALHALGDAGSRATRAVRSGGRGSRAPEAAPRSAAAAKPSTRSRTSKRPSGASDTAKRAEPARTGRTASSRRSSSAAAGGRERSRPSASGRAPFAQGNKDTAAPRGAATRRSARARKGTPARVGAATPARKRAPRGANRDAVLRVVGERPGVTARELAAASQVTGGTLYTLLRRLTDDGTLEKRELPGGQTGYALATSPGIAAESAAAQPRAATSEAGPGAEPGTPARPERNRDSTGTADAAR